MKKNIEEISKEDIELIKKMNENPEVKEGVKRIVGISVDDAREYRWFDDAEDGVTEGLQKLGKSALEGWAKKKAKMCEEEIRENGRKIKLKEKKRNKVA